MKKVVLTLLVLLFLNTISYSKVISENVKINIPPKFYSYEFTLKELINIYPVLKELKEAFKDNYFDLNARIIIVTDNKNKAEFVKSFTKDYKFLDSPKFNFIKAELNKIYTLKNSVEFHDLMFSLLKKLDFYNDKTMWIAVGDIELKNYDNIKNYTFDEIKDEIKKEISKFEKDTTANPYGYKVSNFDYDKNYFNEIIISAKFETNEPTAFISKIIVSFKDKKPIMAHVQCWNNCEYVDFLFNSILQPSFLLKKSNYIKTDNVKQEKDIPKQLEELYNLYKAGALTEKEFKAAKAKILQ